jgi:hypothetical protein
VYPPTRLTISIQGRVLPGLPNNVRTSPDSNAALVGEIPGGSVFTVLAGPQCDQQGIVWWQVDFDGLIGWTAEGANGTYFIEPAPGALLPVGLEVITADNAAQATEVSRLQGNYALRFAWSQQTETDAPALLIALGGLGAGGAWIYDTNALSEPPRILDPQTLLSQVVVGPDALLPLFGANDGTIRLWDISQSAPVLERVQLQSQDSPVSAVAFSPDGTTLAAAGGRAILQQDELQNQFAIALWDAATVSLSSIGLRGHNGEVTALAFHPDSQTLYSGSLDGTVRLWNVTDGTSTVIEVDAPVNSLVVTADGSQLVIGLADSAIQIVDAGASIVAAFAQNTAAVTGLGISPDNTLIATGDLDGVIRIWDMEGRQELVVLQGHTGAIEHIAFSPDGTLLASLAEDNTLRLWAVVPPVG